MRKLKLQVQMSVDGFVGGPNGEMGFLARNWEAGIIEYVTALTESMDCIVLGRKLAQGFIPHWAGVAADPAHPEHLAGIKFTTTPKMVFSRTLEKSEWQNTVLAKGNLVDEITRLKQQPGKDIIAYGGATFVADLVRNNLIDEYHLFINPAAIGSGLSIFETLEGQRSLSLVKATAFDCGIVVLNYAPSRNETRVG
jgi:dihydrofolate reductase